MKNSMLAIAGIAGCAAVAFAAAPEAGARSANVQVVAMGASASSAAAGKAIYARCAACHAVAPDGPRKLGPHMGGIVGRKAGVVNDARYSAAMKSSGVVWDRKTLDAFLLKPSDVVPGTSMSFGGIMNDQQRAALIDYLATLD